MGNKTLEQDLTAMSHSGIYFYWSLESLQLWLWLDDVTASSGTRPHHLIMSLSVSFSCPVERRVWLGTSHKLHTTSDSHLLSVHVCVFVFVCGCASTRLSSVCKELHVCSVTFALVPSASFPLASPRLFLEEEKIKHLTPSCSTWSRIYLFIFLNKRQGGGVTPALPRRTLLKNHFMSHNQSCLLHHKRLIVGKCIFFAPIQSDSALLGDFETARLFMKHSR